MKFIEQDYEVQELKAGKYAFERLEWMHKDDNGNPILKKRSNSDRLTAYANIYVQGNEESVQMSIDVENLPTLPVAFGFKTRHIEPVPPINNAGAISRYLTDLAELVNESGVTPPVDVGDGGWVNWIDGMEIPLGVFTVSLVDITPKDRDSGEPQPKSSQYGQFFFCRFVVRAGEGGNDTPFKGCSFAELINYGFTITQDDDGMDQLDFERKATGKYSGAAVRHAKLIRATAPDTLVDDEFVPPNIYNVLPFWLENLDTSVCLEVQRVDVKGRVKMSYDFSVVGRWDGEEVQFTDGPVKPKPAKRKKDVKTDQPKKAAAPPKEQPQLSAQMLRVVEMADIIAGESIVDDQNKFTSAGRKFAGQWFKPIKDQLSSTRLSDLTDEDAAVIANHIYNSADETDIPKNAVLIAADIIGEDLFPEEPDASVDGDSNGDDLEIPDEFGDTEWGDDEDAF